MDKHSLNFLKYFWTRTVVNSPQEVPIPQFTNAVLVVNIAPVGGAQAFVNGYEINPRLVAGTNGEPWSIGGNYMEIIDWPGLEITFGAGTAAVFVQFKVYKIQNCC